MFTLRIIAIMLLLVPFLAGCSQDPGLPAPPSVTPQNTEPCCKPPNTPAPVSASRLTLEWINSPVDFAAGEIAEFIVMLDQGSQADDHILVTLETIQGANWKVALCYKDHCFMHDGKNTLSELIEAEAVMEFDLKVFVLDSAQPGQDKTFRLSAAPEDFPDQAVSITLSGVLP